MKVIGPPANKMARGSTFFPTACKKSASGKKAKG